MKEMKKRRFSLFPNLKFGNDSSFSQSIEEDDNSFPFALDSSVKQWNSMKELGELRSNADNEEEHIEDCGGHGQRWSLRGKVAMLKLNIGGRLFQIATKVAARYPYTRIGKLALCPDPIKKLSLCDDYSVLTNEYFFDRDPTLFHYIFHFYRSGILWVMQELCPMNFEEEIQYWGLRMRDMHRCCRILFEEKQDELNDYLKVQRELLAQIEPEHKEEHFEGMFLGELRKNVWNLMENPYCSIQAKVFAVFSSIFVLISIVAMTLNTVDDLRYTTSSGKTYMEHIETFCILFFTTEYFLRLLCTCNIKHFLRSALNFVDLLAIMPYFVQVMFEWFANHDNSNYEEDLQAMQRVSKLSKVLKVIRLMRIFRILKLARHSTGLRAFGFTIRQCYQQVCCLFLFIGMGIFTFSALMHSVEHDVPGTPFSSIPDAWWWAAVSISTVGYGDTVPESVLGRFVAFGCISFGIILNGMPISILFNKFSDYYAKLKEQEGDTAVKLRGKVRLRQRALRKLSECCTQYVTTSSGEASTRSTQRLS
ncbi:potassium voltage-gated channel subfamily V member 2 [Erpetoichthys calabaricus]|uniref:Si:rp71-39b20.4 n=1 Tax=Erpetoichthys calabaricus TaxID=27687 RepID=A0A8C4XI90_ERPCA|nr:potassium voltage-gated channel subfamily V member 2 [Erpetoichthys calabaricus]